MNKTTHYQLNQWEPADQVRRTDFNADNAKIDAAIQAVAASVPRIATGSYVGTGTYNSYSPNSITFPFPPLAVAVIIDDTGRPAAGTFLIRGQSRSSGIGNCISSTETYALTVYWEGNTVTWFSDRNASFQLNQDGKTYRYFAIG